MARNRTSNRHRNRRRRRAMAMKCRRNRRLALRLLLRTDLAAALLSMKRRRLPRRVEAALAATTPFRDPRAGALGVPPSSN